MALENSVNKICCKCFKVGSTFTCDGCQRIFCATHVPYHRQELSLLFDNILEQISGLKHSIDRNDMNQSALQQINTWEQDFIVSIQSAAEQARQKITELTHNTKQRLQCLTEDLSNELHNSQNCDTYMEYDIERWEQQIFQLKDDYHKSCENIELKVTDLEDISPFIVIRTPEKPPEQKDLIQTRTPSRAIGCDSRSLRSPSPGLIDDTNIPHSASMPTICPDLLQTITTPHFLFQGCKSKNEHIMDLLSSLKALKPMDKYGPMAGRCAQQTEQMQKFLEDNFGFRNIPGEFIIPAVKSFQLNKPPSSLNKDLKIYFPVNTPGAFVMSVQEILKWQRSVKVYAYKNLEGMNKDFLQRALRGAAKDGDEAALLKYVVRISTCPILMEFDAKIIPRGTHEDWPHRIKLITGVGIDLAGRKHDVDDICYYVSNWRDLYEVDDKTQLPKGANERDLCLKQERPTAKLHATRLLQDLKYMVRLRLRACDAEGVQIVVETGLGLGVFSGSQIGTSEMVKEKSALALREILDEDGLQYKNIRAVVLALPIFQTNQAGNAYTDAFYVFAKHFQEPLYKGTIPVFIADQDMHRLAVAIARRGYVVSELNPGDSYCSFGQFWQNNTPAVEERLALTTAGLLVQHHFINREILSKSNYILL